MRPAPALLRQDTHAGLVQHGESGGVSHEVGPVLPGDRSGQPPVVGRAERGGDGIGRPVEERQHGGRVRCRCAPHWVDDGGRL
jgi:hypothetical protein